MHKHVSQIPCLQCRPCLYGGAESYAKSIRCRMRGVITLQSVIGWKVTEVITLGITVHVNPVYTQNSWTFVTLLHKSTQVKVKVSSSTLWVKFTSLVSLLSHTLLLTPTPNVLDYSGLSTSHTRIASRECKQEGTKYPRSGGKGENTPFTNNVDKKSVNDLGLTVESRLGVLMVLQCSPAFSGLILSLPPSPALSANKQLSLTLESFPQ